MVSDGELSKKPLALALPELREETPPEREFLLLILRTVYERTGTFALDQPNHARNCGNISNAQCDFAIFPMKYGKSRSLRFRGLLTRIRALRRQRSMRICAAGELAHDVEVFAE